jgi:hypothetical protein
VQGWNWCGAHGGPNPDHGWYGQGGNIVTGKQSHYPLVRLSAKYGEMQKDGKLLSNRDSLAIVRHRIQTLLERIDLNEAPDRLAKIARIWDKFRTADRLKDNLSMIEAKAEMDDLIEQATTDYVAWKQMFDALDLDRKLVESEVKIIKDMHAIMTMEDAYEFQAKLLNSIVTTVNYMPITHEVRVQFLQRIQYEFTRLIGESPDRGLGASSGEDDDSGSDILDGEGISDPGDEERPEAEGTPGPDAIPEGRIEGSPDEGRTGEL